MSPDQRQAFVKALPGLALCVLLAVIAIFAARVEVIEKQFHFSPLLLVVLLGMAISSVFKLPDGLVPGVKVAQRPVLRWAVAGLGFKLSLQELLKIGGPALVVVTISTVASLAFGWWIARQMKLGEKLGLLLGVGTSICGASAVVAADSVVQGENSDSAFSLGIITLLGTVGIIIYPLIGRLMGLSDFSYGVWNGASLHEMAQVVAAGHAYSPGAVDVSTVTKLARICLLAPCVFYLAWSLRAHHKAAGTAKVQPVPWFLVLFLVFVAVNSTSTLSKDQVKLLVEIDLWLLTIGMAGVGLQTGFKDLAAAGSRPIIVGLIQWTFLAALSLALTLALVR